MTKSKILYVAFQSNNQANGGLESLQHIIFSLQKFSACIVTQIENQRTKLWREKLQHVRVWRSIFPGLINMIHFNIRTFFFILYNPDIKILHCNDIQSMMHAALGARMAGRPVLFNLRDIKKSGDTYGLKWRWFFFLTTQVIVLSDEMKSVLLSRTKLNPKKINWIYSIVDLEKFNMKDRDETAAYRAQLGVLGDFIVGNVAAVFSKKQQLEFLQAIAGMKHKLKGLKFYFVGDFSPENNAYAKACLQAVEENGLWDYVVFTGFQKDVWRWYNVFDISIIISEREGLARGMIESLACGTPVVSFDVCSAKEILENHHCGKVINQGDYESLIHTLLDLKQRDYSSWITNARKLAEQKFNREKNIQQYESLYESLIR